MFISPFRSLCENRTQWDTGFLLIGGARDMMFKEDRRTSEGQNSCEVTETKDEKVKNIL